MQNLIDSNNNEYGVSRYVWEHVVNQIGERHEFAMEMDMICDGVAEGVLPAGAYHFGAVSVYVFENGTWEEAGQCAS